MNSCLMGAGDVAGQAKDDRYTVRARCARERRCWRANVHIGGTGTMTYRNGNKIMRSAIRCCSWRGVKVPMARAEIIATVPSYSYPYKIPHGQVIARSRRTGSRISGEIGAMPRDDPVCPSR